MTRGPHFPAQLEVGPGEGSEVDLEALAARQGLRQGRDRSVCAAHVTGKELDEQAAFVAEVLVHRLLGHLCYTRNLIHARAEVAVAKEQVRSDLFHPP